ncbi:MAG TPA: TlpA disulfide reductase family protein [Thermomicrobiales bacterium]|nr:TlpA disulfide reductase family protein [Thermomicrobiales bacterium]
MSDNDAHPSPSPDPTASPEPVTLADDPADNEGRIGYGLYGRYTPFGLAALIIVVIVAIGVYQQRDKGDSGTKAGDLIGSTAPNVTLTLFDGSSLDLAELRGKVVVVNFWAQWCDPCKKESPLLQQFSDQAKAGGDNVAIIGVDIKSDDVSKARAFVAEHGLTYPIGQDRGGSDPLHGEIETAFGTPFGYPTTIFISPKGKVTANHVGPLNEQLLTQYVQDAATQ